MLNQNTPLISISLPWEDTLDIKEMHILPKETPLSEIGPLPDQKDIALKDHNGMTVGWLPFSKLAQTIFHQWKILLSYYQTLLQAVDDAVAVVDKHGKIVSWNPKAEELYQCSGEDILGKPITDFFKKESVVLMSTLQDGKGVVRKYNQPHPNVHVLINTLPVYDGQSVIGGVSVERNISDMVKLNDELSTTTAIIHDLESKIETTYANDPFYKIKGRSQALYTAIDLAKKVSATDASVLLTGESGVGKELFARAIHKSSPRSDQPFIDINCGAIPAALFESELFGYEKGAFTGAAKQGKKGKIEAAKGGSLFLDEIGELPLDLQVKLLRVIQEKEFYRVGGNTPIPIDIRIIAATNRDLEKMVNDGLFRQDLFYRLNVVSIEIPPLRERIEDIPELIQLFLKEFSIKYKKAVPEIDPEVMYTFLHYPWSGNIRQLRNTIERIMILIDEDMIHLHHLPKNFIKNKPDLKLDKPVVESPTPVIENEKMKLKEALAKTYGNKSAAAKLLGISRVTLYNKIKKYNL
ncbi:PAS domain S-box-containing protein [Scopulibacillus daqui]|uniref:PAS domain S-box-containing protein n=1 Tax=Scopulibacillus daqui TaxID=1469162 RepID=A0ABS2PX63_9BACL|nr:sigma 54-interacting transcriptional regulator [Scopulibacillus daqui]MBM7644626.1 PAS domain S-box-containing protein [Scopulibacillus daqui]